MSARNLLAAASLAVLALAGCSEDSPPAQPADTVELCVEEAYGAGMKNMADTAAGQPQKKLLIKDLESCDDLTKAQQDQARDIAVGRATSDILGGAGKATPSP